MWALTLPLALTSTPTPNQADGVTVWALPLTLPLPLPLTPTPNQADGVTVWAAETTSRSELYSAVSYPYP